MLEIDNMQKIYILILMVFFFHGCGAYSIKEQADIDVKYNYYQDLLNFRQTHSADKCVQKFRDNNILNEYNLSNGNFVYAAPVMCGCIIHWEIDRKTKKIVGYKFEGENCPKK